MKHAKTKESLSLVLRNALALNADLYENARNRPRTHRIALTIVILAAVSHMLGSAVILLINRASILILGLALLLDGASVVLGYYFWTFTIWKIGNYLSRHSPSYGDLLSPIGFAYAPQVLNFLTLIPLMGQGIGLVLAAWSLLAVIVAVRQGLDLSTRAAALICLVGWPLVQIAIGLIQVSEQWFVKAGS
ncbi:YIP1 family protein [Leptolyngbya sp. FACHB-261]|uniref:YIP1 family protein n=1 Tax=Leptolyngbya sp. FACHB-261 TaxID=2692806 RepID=UPI0016854AA8|nr:YIP1 family protein [Leptolyngbya sp. FACHB-261]MBD2103355.1 YIP1 family protein [Leptolyngbya sp. FACHB-261]